MEPELQNAALDMGVFELLLSALQQYSQLAQTGVPADAVKSSVKHASKVRFAMLCALCAFFMLFVCFAVYLCARQFSSRESTSTPVVY